MEEIRIVVCADGDVVTHLHDKHRHNLTVKPKESAVVQLEKFPVGTVHLTETRPGAAEGNRGVYRRLAEELDALREKLAGPDRRARVILDADREVAYEHVIGVLNACQERGITNVEFVGDSTLDRYFGGGTGR